MIKALIFFGFISAAAPLAFLLGWVKSGIKQPGHREGSTLSG